MIYMYSYIKLYIDTRILIYTINYIIEYILEMDWNKLDLLEKQLLTCYDVMLI